MKKLVAILLTCMTITCAFASCGDSDGSSSKSSSASSSKVGYEDNDDGDDDTSKSSKTDDEDDDDTSKSSKTDDEDDDDTSKSSKPDDDDVVTTIPADMEGSIDSQLLGTWKLDDDEEEVFLSFDFDNTFDMGVNFTEILHFDGDDLYVEDEKVPADGVVFEGNSLTINYEGIEFLKLDNKRYGDGTGKYDGIYKVTGGMLGEAYTDDVDMDCMSVEFRDGECFMTFSDVGNYAAKDGELILYGALAEDIFDFDGAETMSYKINGDTMESTDSSGVTEKLVRVK